MLFYKVISILPGAASTEKNGTYVSTEGRAQQGWRAIFPVGDAREDWAIVRALSGALDQTLPYNNIDAVRSRMVELSPTFASLNVPTKAEWTDFGKAGDMKPEGFASPVRNFYMTDPISRASVTMAWFSPLRTHGKTGSVHSIFVRTGRTDE